MMSLVAAVAVSFLAVGAPEAPIRVTGVSSEYCPRERVVEMLVENVSERELLVAFVVQKQGESGQWQDFSSDVFGTKPHPKQVTVLRMAKGTSRRVRWLPARSSNVRGGLSEGSYRILVNALDPERPPAREYVVAHFAVRPVSRCRPHDGTRKSPAQREEKH